MSEEVRNELIYNVWRENINTREIEVFNIFKSCRFFDSLINAKAKFKQTSDIDEFKKNIKSALMYAYWCKSEYEIVLTSWPPFTDVKNISKMQQEIEEHNNRWNTKQLCVNVPLSVAKKVDIYEQVMLNFDLLFQYILNNIENIPSRQDK